jgi:RNA polymerase sigma-70 factor (ECF subfamily)
MSGRPKAIVRWIVKMASQTLHPPSTEPERAALELDLAGLYRSHAERVARWVHRLAGPGAEADADDLVQEVFLTAGPLLPRCRFEQLAAVDVWIYRITENLVRRHRRRERWRAWITRWTDRAETVPSMAASPPERLEQREALALAYRVLDGMDEKYRTVFILYELEGCTGEEVAALTGARAGTVAVRLHRAREQFAARLARLEKRESAPLADWTSGCRLDVVAPEQPVPRGGA